MVNRQIGGTGPLNAKIVVVGDSPTIDEVRSRKPFSSPTNKLLYGYIKAAGLSDLDLRFEYLMEASLNGKHFSSVDNQTFYSCVSDLQTRLTQLKDVKVVVPIGIYATKALLGSRFRGISDDHCYVFPPAPGANYYIIPCLDLNYVLRGNMDESIFIMTAFGKAATVSACPPEQKSMDLIIAPSWHDIQKFMSEPHNGLVSVDIETTKTTNISSIALSYDGWRAIAIPFIVGNELYWSRPQKQEIDDWLKGILLDPAIGKVYQNFIFDTMVLWKHGFSNKGEIHDTMTRSHLCSPEMGKGLADLGRMHLYRPSWKGWDNFDKIKDWKGFWKYNALDAAYTMQIFHSQEETLKMLGVDKFYDEHLVALSRVVFDICTLGWNIDRAGLLSTKSEIDGIVARLKAEMEEIAKPLGIEKLNPNSPKQLKELFKLLKFKIPTKDGKETTNEQALAKLALKYNHKIFELLREYRKESKFLSTYLNMDLDSDDRLRFTYIIPGTVTSRFSSKETPWGTGTNSQNIHPRFKRFVKPDPGKVLIQTDLDRADAQVVARLAKEDTMLELLRTGADLHVFTANMIFDQDIKLLPEEEYKRCRKIGKAANHALNYGMQAKTFRDRLLQTADLVISMEEAVKVVEGYFKAYPKILDWQDEIRATITREKKLVTPHGRVRFFLGWVNDKMFRDAYAYIPPTTVSDALNVTAVKLVELIQNNYVNMQIIGQCHDSLLLQVAERHLDIGLELLDQAMKSSVFYIHEQPCVIPHGVEVGNDWGSLKPYDRRKQ